MLLSDGRRIVPSTHPLAASHAPNIIISHPDFRMIVLANRPGFPFLGNDFFGSLGNILWIYSIAYSLTAAHCASSFSIRECLCASHVKVVLDLINLLCLQVTSSAVMPLTTQVLSLRWLSYALMGLMCLRKSCGTLSGHSVSCVTWQTRHSSSTHTQPGRLLTSLSTCR